MNQFIFKYGVSAELELFPHIKELGSKKNNAIQLNSFLNTTNQSIRIYFIMDGKYNWNLHNKEYTLYPTDVALVMPHQTLGSENGYLEIGNLTWIHITFDKDNWKNNKWTGLNESEIYSIIHLLLRNESMVLLKFTEVGRILLQIQVEIINKELGFYSRVNQLVTELLIVITRQLTKQCNTGRDFPKTFLDLEQSLRQNLSHQWTVEEMAALVGLGTTIFNEKVKNYSGFTPLNYLINIRIAEAIKLLKKPSIHITDIALDTGFYSSQHFATTFKKLTGYTPSQFRKNNSQLN